MPPRRSERLRLLREVASTAEPVTEPRVTARRQRARRRAGRTRARLPARQARTNTATVLDQREDPRTWLQLEAHSSARSIVNQNGEGQPDDVLTLRLLSLFIRIALLESPSLAQLTRRNPNQGIRKLFRIIRFLFFRR
ncbi:uncharacterized protein LOC111601577 [Drosophila hydei]|uniref:Uncharacterized protein LOC111601577 n=1 Tax=Drosophila hydei TaxID=7224 RepID=A0A6J1MAL0_DROHY|nr:uncharacterized protein LOC111601577 [Drosophila hydei]